MVKLSAFLVSARVQSKKIQQGRLVCQPKRKWKSFGVSRVPPRATLIPNNNIINKKLVSIAFGATAKLISTAFIGYVAAVRGILDSITLRSLSRVVYWIFLPALLLVNICNTLNSGVGAQYIFLPFAAMAIILAGLLVGLLFSRLLKLNPIESRLFLVSSAFGNSAALPLLFVNSLAQSPEQLAGLTAGISFYLLVWTTTFWSLGYHLLATLSSNTEKKIDETMKSKIFATLKRLVSPPLVASLVGVFIGLSPAPMRAFIMSSPLFAALKTLGAGYSPAAILILGGSLVPSKGPGNSDQVPNLRLGRLSSGLAFTRFLVMPLLGLSLLKTGLFSHPMAGLTLLLESVTPPAQNSIVILYLEGKPEYASALARVLVLMYTFGALPVSGWLSYFLGVVGFA